ncbi:hypothetical protein HK099_006855 [Clydaea vesicula]|uniref:Uncharacterized protein n=1 Tax=Clydaea vesicula TaxID=447962 RepID=A0AAD5XWR8_9FUNG|nr:hypothetical protein HK099_006855 [Clydaea vesicula]
MVQKLLFASFICTPVLSWGLEGHFSVAGVAEKYLNEKTKSFVKYFTENDAPFINGSIWADSVKYNDKVPGIPFYPWSKNLHFADTFDDPTTGNCTYDDHAVHEEFKEEYIIPLHVCGDQIGGNGRKVFLYNGKSNSTFTNDAGKTFNSFLNLHHIWDVEIVVQRMQEVIKSEYEPLNRNYVASMEPINEFVDYLYNKLEEGKGDFANKENWVKTLDSDWDKVNEVGHWVTPIEWAVDSNGFNCKYVYPDYLKDIKADLATNGYYETVKTAIDIQIAKGGFRLANVLNRAFASCELPLTTATPQASTVSTATPHASTASTATPQASTASTAAPYTSTVVGSTTVGVTYQTASLVKNNGGNPSATPYNPYGSIKYHSEKPYVAPSPTKAEPVYPSYPAAKVVDEKAYKGYPAAKVDEGKEEKAYKGYPAAKVVEEKQEKGYKGYLENKALPTKKVSKEEYPSTSNVAKVHKQKCHY